MTEEFYYDNNEKCRERSGQGLEYPLKIFFFIQKINCMLQSKIDFIQYTQMFLIKIPYRLTIFTYLRI